MHEHCNFRIIYASVTMEDSVRSQDVFPRPSPETRDHQHYYCSLAHHLDCLYEYRSIWTQLDVNLAKANFSASNQVNYNSFETHPENCSVHTGSHEPERYFSNRKRLSRCISEAWCLVSLYNVDRSVLQISYFKFWTLTTDHSNCWVEIAVMLLLINKKRESYEYEDLLRPQIFWMFL